MVHTVETARVYLDTHRQGVVTCIYCGIKRSINMSKYTDNYIGGKSLKVKCGLCGRVFQVKFDFRRYPRINVSLPGKILYVPARKELGNIIIVSLSINGIGFLMNCNEALKQNEIYEIIFHLDDDNNSIICEEVMLKRINGPSIGAEFYHNDRYNDKLHLYIMSDL